MNRFFKTTPQVYEAVRANLDQLYGHPFYSDPENPTVATTETCMPTASQAPTDGEGFVYVGLIEADAQRPEIAASIVELLASSAIQEVTEEEYQAAVSTAP
jgi:hypothetical protein